MRVYTDYAICQRFQYANFAWLNPGRARFPCEYNVAVVGFVVGVVGPL